MLLVKAKILLFGKELNTVAKEKKKDFFSSLSKAHFCILSTLIWS